MIWMIADFGTKYLKCLKVDIENNGIKVVDYARFDAQPEYFSGLGFPTEAAWNALNVGLNEITWITEQATAISAHLPSVYLETRYLRFPFTNDRKIEKVLPLEIEAAVPFDVDELLLRKRILSGAGVQKGNEALVFVSSYKRELIQKFETQLQKFQQSIPPISVDILNLSSLRQALPKEPVMGLLNMGHTKSQFLLMQEDGHILAARSFFWGGQLLQQQLKDALQLNDKRACDLLQNQASFEINQESQAVHVSMAEALESSLNHFMNEFRRSLKSFQHQGLDIPKSCPVYVLGQPALIPGLRGRMQERYKSEFDLSFEAFPMNALYEIIPGLENLENPMEAVPAAAQALAQTRQHRGRIPSFSESSFQFQQNIKKFQEEGLAIAKRVALVLIFPALYFLLQLVVTGQEEARIKDVLVENLNQSRINLRTQGNLGSILNQLDQLEQSYKIKANKMQEDESSPLLILQDLSARIPEALKIDVTEFDVSDSKVLVKAETNSEMAKTKILEEVQRLYADAKTGGSESCTRYPGCISFRFEFDRPQEGLTR